MALRMGALYDALLAGNVPEDKARQAAEEAANYERSISDIRTDLTLLKWMVAFVLAIVVGLALKAVFG